MLDRGLGILPPKAVCRGYIAIIIDGKGKGDYYLGFRVMGVGISITPMMGHQMDNQTENSLNPKP